MSEFRIFINPYCGNCESAISLMRAAVIKRGFDEPAVINLLDDIDLAVSLHITRVPALVYGESVLVQGAVNEAGLRSILGSLAVKVSPND